MLRELPRTSPGTRGGRSVRILCDAGGLGAGKRGRGIPKAKETAACIVLPGRPAGPADRADRTEASAAMSACTRAAALAGALPIDSWRLERALHQRIFLLDRPRPARHKFEVMGTRGIAYVVMLAADDDAGTSAETGASGYHVHPTSRAWDEDFPSCTCPDFKERRILCEHILSSWSRSLTSGRPSPATCSTRLCVGLPRHGSTQLEAMVRAVGAVGRVFKRRKRPKAFQPCPLPPPP